MSNNKRRIPPLPVELRRFRPRSVRPGAKMLRQFAQETTFHGMQYIFNDKSPLFDR